MARKAETGYMLLFFVALLVWFALSVPATLLVGRVIAASSRNTLTPLRARPMMSAQSLRR
ncbi:MAG TPA: hypothetical protein VMZ73_03435 [Acidimicrobiales bacterium]|nr:hypothetical protein [Acidimicrobiales bacterium]